MIIVIAPLFSADTNDILSALKQRQDSITSTSAEIAIVISSSRGAVAQKGAFYYQAPDKTRIDITSPMKQSMVFNGKTAYLKNINETKYRKMDMPNAAETYNDMFLYAYLCNQFLEIESETVKDITFVAYKDATKNTKTFWGIFDKKLNVVPHAKIFAGTGSAGMFSAMDLAFTNISGIVLAYKIVTDTTVGGIQAKTITELRNITVNKPISSSVWQVQ
ncbi:MAG: outer-membrane lipoprotein carrier protein LolA [Candidatus Omnitrophica bacterium]|nr:outer-membrane lipoprotein carrier protein LolA [Candidatus Omnitrophota bacterium]